MTSKSGEIVMAATVFFPDLVAVVMNHLDALHEKGRLIWHGGAIPESEIWLKIGGDHGGGSFKFSMQIVNTAQPNPLTNTIPVCIFNAKDSPANLETALSVYREQLEQLQQSGWQDKSIKFFYSVITSIKPLTMDCQDCQVFVLAFTAYVPKKTWHLKWPAEQVTSVSALLTHCIKTTNSMSLQGHD